MKIIFIIFKLKTLLLLTVINSGRYWQWWHTFCTVCFNHVLADCFESFSSRSTITSSSKAWNNILLDRKMFPSRRAFFFFFNKNTVYENTNSIIILNANSSTLYLYFFSEQVYKPFFFPKCDSQNSTYDVVHLHWLKQEKILNSSRVPRLL